MKLTKLLFFAPYLLLVLFPFKISAILTSQSSQHFSLFNEDLILEQLLKEIPNIAHFYVDIGADDGMTFSNTAKLAQRHWKGVAFEVDPQKCSRFLENYRLRLRVKLAQQKVTPLNVTSLLDSYQAPQRFGVLSLDIDSYDYFVLDTLLQSYHPTIIIAEINEKIPPPLRFTVLFKEDHVWDFSHFFGQSITLLGELAKKYGYIIHCLEYNNVFLIDSQAWKGDGLTVEEAYRQGYADRTDHLDKLPWNRNVEKALELSPDEAVDFFNAFFAPYAGRYTLDM